jgi:hypothetical protein
VDKCSAAQLCHMADLPRLSMQAAVVQSAHTHFCRHDKVVVLRRFQGLCVAPRRAILQ